MSAARRTATMLLSLLLVAALLISLPGGAGAAPPAPPPGDGADPTEGGDADLPPDWSLRSTPTGLTLAWASDEVRMGGARPEFRLGDEVLGFPRETDEGLELVLTPEQDAEVGADPDRLEVWSSGRRLDVPPAEARPLRAPQEPGRTPSLPTDPAVEGPYRTERLSYDLEPLVLEGYPAPIEVRAEITRPMDARGRRPLVLILHGRHSTCFTGGPDGESSGQWPCPAGWEPIPSHLGYRYLTDVLASQGYLAVSISANGINGQDWAAPDAGTSARSQLIRHHLELWARWANRGGDPWGGVVRHRVDMREVVLVGHSRGGEGVNRAAIDALGENHYEIRGLVSYGPTAFGRQVTPDVTSAVILPACDGDVLDLQGQAYVDWSRDIASSDALRSAVLALGANHNYFNSEWTPGLAQAPAWDDWFDPSDPVCGDEGSLRLSVEEQQQVGAAYTLALVRLAVERDAGMLPFLDGTKAKPASIGRAEVSVSPVGGSSMLLYRPETEEMPDLLEGMTGRRCPGYVPWSVEVPADGSEGSPCAEGFWAESTPHWQVMWGVDTRPAPMALELAWSEPSSAARFALGTKGHGIDLSKDRTLDVRVANDPHAAPAELQVRVRDTAGRSAVLSTDLAAIEAWPGSGILERVQARTLRADLTSAGRVDLRRVATVEIVATGAPGRVWVLDIAAAQARVTSPRSLDLPRLSVETAYVPEGGADEVTTVDVEIRVEGHVRRPTTVWAQVATKDGTGDVASGGFPIELKAGAKGVVATVPLSFVGDDIYTPPYPGGDPLDGGVIQLVSLTGGLTTEYIGGVTTVEDEEPPILSVDEAHVTATEGDSLEWTLRLSGPTSGAFYLFGAEPPDGEVTELDSDDVDQDWLEEQLWWLDAWIPLPIDPPMPLSRIGRDQTGHGLPVPVSFEYGQTEVILEVPLRFDDLEEGDEWVALAVQHPWWDQDPTIPPEGLGLTGTVPAHGAADGLPDWADSAVAIAGTFGEEQAEEAVIDAIVGDARVVLAGELSRGAAQAVETRAGLIADLVDRHDVTDVRFDEPLPRSVAAARYVAFGTGTAESAVQGFSDELRRTVEAVTFLETLHGRSVEAAEPVLLLGLDPGGEPAALVDLIELHDPALAASVACFDLDPVAADDWYLVPPEDRESCRQELLAARDALAATAAASARDEAGFDSHVAHAAAVALLTAEATAALDPASDGYGDVRATLRAEGLADGLLAALEVTTATVVGALDDLDAAVLRDVAEPRIGPASSPAEVPPIVGVTVARSTGAVLVDVLGREQVASVGVTAGRGEVLTYYSTGWERWLSTQSLDRPARGSVERMLSSFGPEVEAFVVPLAGTEDLASPGLMRIAIRDEYRAWEPQAWYVPLRASEAFDGLIHVRRMRATTLLTQRAWLELDGAAVAVVGACYDWDADRIQVTFDGGSLTGTAVYEDDWLATLMATLSFHGVEYTGVLSLEWVDGWAFAGQLVAEGDEVLEVAGFLPWDLPGC
jgi:erythromycin esterase-like protein